MSCISISMTKPIQDLWVPCFVHRCIGAKIYALNIMSVRFERQTPHKDFCVSFCHCTVVVVVVVVIVVVVIIIVVVVSDAFVYPLHEDMKI